jgi:alkylation response protein AidB-like acyl-CoA dehydrogenase
MDLFLTEEQVLFRESIARFARNELASGALQRAQSDDYPRDVARLIAKQGLIGITLSEADGGQGGSLLDAVIAIEQVALACPRSADIVQAGNFGAIRTFAEYGTADQKRRYLPGLLAGEDVIAVAMTEPNAGSALTELSTSARRDGNGYRLNGSKIFTTNSRHASLFLAYVRFGPGVAGIGSILVDRDTPGLEFGKPSRFMNGEEWQQLHFDDCHVPEANVLLPAGGFKRQIKGFNVERIGNSARSLALGRLAFNIAKEHAETRHQFGRALCDFQGIQWKFAEMAIKLEAAQLLLYKAATHPADELPSAYDTAIAKVACNRAGFEIANEALQTMGGHGFSCESLVQYCMRRTRGWMIAGGSIEVLLNRISESVFDRRFSQRVQQEAAE